MAKSRWRSRKRHSAAAALGIPASRRPWSVLREMLNEAPAAVQEEYRRILGERPEINGDGQVSESQLQK